MKAARKMGNMQIGIRLENYLIAVAVAAAPAMSLTSLAAIKH